MPDAPPRFLSRLLEATNAGDVDGIAGCFTPDYRNQTPVHPERGFEGAEQVRTNWRQILTFVPDLQALVVGYTVDGDRIWSEWEMNGTRLDDTRFLIRGVIVFELADGLASSARFYLEPVDQSSSSVDDAVRVQVHAGRQP